MSRYQKWTQAYKGLINAIEMHGFKPKMNNRLINEFSAIYDIKGSQSERVLIISQRFQDFKSFLTRKRK